MGQVSLKDLSKSARNSIMVSDLPREAKYDILKKWILPKLCDSPHKGELAKLEDEYSPKLIREVRLTVPNDDNYVDLDGSGIRLTFNVEFESPMEEMAFQMGERIGFRGESWLMVGKVERRRQISPGNQMIVAWISLLDCDGFAVFDEK